MLCSKLLKKDLKQELIVDDYLNERQNPDMKFRRQSVGKRLSLTIWNWNK